MAHQASDLYLFGETHEKTPLKRGFRIMKKRRIGSLALEGLPAGEISPQMRGVMIEEQADFNKGLEAFHRRTNEILPLADLVDTALWVSFTRDIGRWVHPEETAYLLTTIMTQSRDLARGGGGLYQSYHKPFGPGIRYLAHGDVPDLRVMGLDDMSEWKDLVKRTIGAIFLRGYNQVRTQLEEAVTTVLSQAREVTTKTYFENLMSAAQRYHGELEQRGFLANIASPLFDDPGPAIARTPKWIEGPLRNESGIMVVCGSNHIDLAVTCASRIGRTTEIVYREL